MIGHCLLSRLTYLSCLVIATFFICITQEFTFILNFRGFMHDSSTLQVNSTSIRPIKIVEKNGHFESGKALPSTFSEDDWKEITGNIYVYSAYWDTRTSNKSVRIIGGAKSTKNNFYSIKCLLQYNKNIPDSYTEVKSTYEILIEHHQKPSKAIYIICTPMLDDPPISVALVPSKWNNTWDYRPVWLQVHSLMNETEISGIGVCVRPMFNYTDVFRVVEFIAYYEALGIQHFAFYNYDSSEDIVKIINEVKKNNYSVEWLPWSLPSQINDMWALGQMASINDCLYRNMKNLAYIVVVDLDEFITPRHVMTLKELMLVHYNPKRNSASFVFRSCVFCSEYKQDILPSVIPPFVTQNSIRREKFIYPFLVRTKYMVKPQKVLVAGVHHVWELLPGYDEKFVQGKYALVHHYRAHLCVNENKTLEKGEVDVMSRKYLNPLMRSKVLHVWKSLFDEKT